MAIKNFFFVNILYPVYAKIFRVYGVGISKDPSVYESSKKFGVRKRVSNVFVTIPVLTSKLGERILITFHA